MDRWACVLSPSIGGSASFWSYWSLSSWKFLRKLRFLSVSLSSAFCVRPPRWASTSLCSSKRGLPNYNRLISFSQSDNSNAETSWSWDSSKRRETSELNWAALALFNSGPCSRIVVYHSDAPPSAILTGPSSISTCPSFTTILGSLYPNLRLKRPYTLVAGLRCILRRAHLLVKNRTIRHHRPTPDGMKNEIEIRSGKKEYTSRAHLSKWIVGNMNWGTMT